MIGALFLFTNLQPKHSKVKKNYEIQAKELQDKQNETHLCIGVNQCLGYFRDRQWPTTREWWTRIQQQVN